MSDESRPKLSVVVIGRNEGLRLRRCLESIRGMDFPTQDVQLIYVDTASTDTSVSIAESCGASCVSINPRGPCAAKARNAGWRLALADFVLFLDGDTILDLNFVTRSLPSFQDSSTAVVFGRRRELNPEQSIYTLVLDLDWAGTLPGESKFCGGDALFRRSILEETGGYDDELIAGEEPELCWRIRNLGKKIVALDLPMTGHDLAMTRWRQYWRRSVRTGYAYAEIATRFRATKEPLWHAEQIRNLIQGFTYSLVAAGGIAGSISRRSPWPLLTATCIFTGLMLRTAYRNRKRPVSLGVLLAYGIHSHVQQLPVLMGQIEYWLNHLRGRRRTLIEYQENAL